MQRGASSAVLGEGGDKVRVGGAAGMRLVARQSRGDVWETAQG